MSKQNQHLEVEAIYQASFDSVYKFFYFKCLDQPLAEDLTSETFMSLAQKLHEQHQLDDPIKYVYGIARNHWNMYLRNKYKIEIIPTADIDDFASFVDESEREWQGKSLEQRALKYIDRLPEKQRIIAYRKLIAKEGNKEIMRSLGVTENYVKVTMRRALRALEKMIELESYEATL